MNLFYVRSIILLGALAAVAGIGLSLKEWGAANEREKVALAAAAAAEKKYAESNRISTALQAQLQQYQNDDQKMKEDRDAQIAKNGVFAACKLPDSSVQLYNAIDSDSAAR